MTTTLVTKPSAAVLEYQRVNASCVRGVERSAQAEGRAWWTAYHETRARQIAETHNLSIDDLIDAWAKWVDEVEAARKVGA